MCHKKSKSKLVLRRFSRDRVVWRLLISTKACRLCIGYYTSVLRLPTPTAEVVIGSCQYNGQQKEGSAVEVLPDLPVIEQTDEEFAGAIKDLCMIGALSPAPGAAGVTFLFPNRRRWR